MRALALDASDDEALVPALWDPPMRPPVAVAVACSHEPEPGAIAMGLVKLRQITFSFGGHIHEAHEYIDGPTIGVRYRSDEALWRRHPGGDLLAVARFASSLGVDVIVEEYAP